ncbi:hypothetical protein CJU89_0804 [Yarrowia sp. B02]|nr:hypothetical protein CJU89_0804 [Yarrowia sp. B02]
MSAPPQNATYTHQQQPNEVSDGCLYLLAVFFPFISVGILRGACSGEMWLCLLLFYFFYIPGLIYAIYIIQKDKEKRKAYDVEQMGQGYASQHRPIQPGYNQQPLHQTQAYPNEGTHPQASAPTHEPAPMTEPPRSEIAPQAPPPTYDGPAHTTNEKAQYAPN